MANSMRAVWAPSFWMNGSSYIRAEPATTPISNEPVELLPVKPPVLPELLPVEPPVLPEPPVLELLPVLPAPEPVLPVEPLPSPTGNSGFDPAGGAIGVIRASLCWRCVPLALRFAMSRSVLVSLRLARLTACRAALQPFGCLRRHAFNALDLDASLWSAAAWAVTAVRRALVVAMRWEEPAAAAALAVSRTRHSATSSVLSGCACAQRERGRVIDIRVISFGSWAVCVRPLALRARLATGVPLSGTCDGACGS